MRIGRRLFVALVAWLLPIAAAAQTYTIAPDPFLTVFNNSGAKISGACVWTYTAGTSTPATTYTSSSGTPNTNPIIADSAGRYTAYLQPGTSYKFVYENTPCSAISHGTVLRTADNISGTPASAASVDITGAAGEAISAGNCVYLSDGSGGKAQGQWYKCDPANTYSSTTNWVGVATTAMSGGSTGTIRLAGSVTGLTSLSVGSKYYAGSGGVLTTTAPANARLVGEADSATSLIVSANPVPFTNFPSTQIGGTSGGVPYFNSGTTVTTSGALTANGIVIGGGAGAAPTTIAVGTNNQVLTGNTGAAPTFAGLASTQLSDFTNWTSWTPTDQSGAALSFTGNAGSYWQLGKVVIMYFSLTYPATASGVAAKISLPVAPLSATTQGGCSVNFNPTAKVIQPQISSGVINLVDNNAAAITNTQMATDSLALTCVYRAN